MSTLSYNLPNLIRVLSITDQLHRAEAIIISQLITDVEDGLEEIKRGGTTKWFCDRKTFDRYCKLTRKTTVPAAFVRSMKAIKEPAFKLIIEHLEQMHPRITE